MHDRTGWTRGNGGPQVIRGKTYTNLTEFTRTCAACNKPFSIFVTSKIANGHADSNSFGLKNCEEHRRNKSDGDVEKLRTANVTMNEELAALYARDRAQFEEIQKLKARLAQYELQSAIGCEAVQNTTSSGPAENLTFPWS